MEITVIENTDQTSKLREMVRRSRQCRTIAITSGKGGVGKSSIALNLSILLSAAGNRVALVDADLGMANLDILLDIKVRYTLAHVIAGQKRLSDIIVELPSGVQLIPGASGLGQIANLGEFQRTRFLSEMRVLEEDNDILIIDTGAGIGPDVLQFTTACDSAIVVTTAEPTAMTDAYAMIKVLNKRQFDGQLSLMVNLASGRSEARHTHQRISSVARQFLGINVLEAGYMLNDTRVKEAVMQRKPFVLAFPRCNASRCLAALAGKLCAGGALVRQKEGFFRRVVNWFA